MSASRIPPPNPRTGELTKSSPADQKIKAVEKLDAVDDETKARKFRQYIDEEEEEEELEASALPTPLSLLSAEHTPSTTKDTLKGLESTAVVGPADAPSPAASLQHFTPKEGDEKNALPQSAQFWENVDEPPNRPLFHAALQSSHSSTKEPTSIFEAQLRNEGAKRGRAEREMLAQLKQVTNTPLPNSVIPSATSATIAAAPYLKPETLSVYFQMIGTIIAMVSPKGDSRTEFILNSPSFAHSPFYGSTVTIERFSTAPYQLNILLTGPATAVNLFNQNLPKLTESFKQGQFSFTVNRIETAYERHLIRRKESKDTGSQEFDERS